MTNGLRAAAAVALIAAIVVLLFVALRRPPTGMSFKVCPQSALPAADTTPTADC